MHWQAKKKKKCFARQKLSAIPVQEFFLRRCGGKQRSTANVEMQPIIQVTGHANETTTPKTTKPNSLIGFSVWSFPTSTEQIQQASKQPSCFYGKQFPIHNLVKWRLASFKDSVVHPKVQISINCLFKVTITEQLTTYRRLTDFLCSYVKAWSVHNVFLKNSRLVYLSQGCNWLVEIKHVSSLEAIIELRVHRSTTVAFSWFFKFYLFRIV